MRLMPYRADLEAQQRRCETLERELADLRLRASALPAIERAIAAKEREIHDARKWLKAMGVPRALPMCESLAPASSCRAVWDEMIGDEQVRFCGHCARHVYNLAAMPREEAEALLRGCEKDGAGGRPCRRADGTVMLADCPVGVRSKRVRRMAVIALTGGLATATMMSLTSREVEGTAREAEESVLPAPVDADQHCGSHPATHPQEETSKPPAYARPVVVPSFRAPHVRR